MSYRYYNMPLARNQKSCLFVLGFMRTHVTYDYIVLSLKITALDSFITAKLMSECLPWDCT